MKIKSLRIGTNESLKLQLYDADTDAALPITGYTGWTASAKHTETGAVVAFTLITVTDAAAGKIKLDFLSTAFTVAGLYDIDLLSTDPAGKLVNYPPDRGTLKMRVDLANE